MAKRIPGPKSLLLGPQPWQATRHPARQDLELALEAMAPCSVADLAAAIDRPAAALYRDMESLVKAGFAVPAGRRAAGRRWTALYACGPFLNMTARHVDASSGRGLREHGELVASLMKTAARDYARAARTLKGSPQREVETVLSSMVERTRFNDRRLRRFKRLARDLHELIREGRRTGRGRRCQISLSASPMAWGEGDVAPSDS